MILLSAYACEPQKGSEPMVGWNHVLEYAKKAPQTDTAIAFLKNEVKKML